MLRSVGTQGGELVSLSHAARKDAARAVKALELMSSATPRRRDTPSVGRGARDRERTKGCASEPPALRLCRFSLSFWRRPYACIHLSIHLSSISIITMRWRSDMLCV